MHKIMAYTRVSTSAQSLENQRLEIQRYAALRGLEVTDWIEDEDFFRIYAGFVGSEAQVIQLPTVVQ